MFFGIVAGLILLLVIIVTVVFRVIAPPDMAYIISGMKKRVIIVTSLSKWYKLTLYVRKRYIMNKRKYIKSKEYAETTSLHYRTTKIRI